MRCSSTVFRSRISEMSKLYCNPFKNKMNDLFSRNNKQIQTESSWKITLPDVLVLNAQPITWCPSAIIVTVTCLGVIFSKIIRLYYFLKLCKIIYELFHCPRSQRTLRPRLAVALIVAITILKSSTKKFYSWVGVSPPGYGKPAVTKFTAETFCNFLAMIGSWH